MGRFLVSACIVISVFLLVDLSGADPENTSETEVDVNNDTKKESGEVDPENTTKSEPGDKIATDAGNQSDDKTATDGKSSEPQSDDKTETDDEGESNKRDPEKSAYTPSDDKTVTNDGSDSNKEDHEKSPEPQSDNKTVTDDESESKKKDPEKSAETQSDDKTATNDATESNKEDPEKSPEPQLDDKTATDDATESNKEDPEKSPEPQLDDKTATDDATESNKEDPEKSPEPQSDDKTDTDDENNQNKSKINIITKSEWNGRETTDELPSLKLLKRVVICHTRGPFCYDQKSCSQRLQNIESFELRSHMKDIGFNFLIGNDGNVYEGRGWDNEGAYDLGKFTDSLAIAFIGYYQNYLPTRKALDALKALIEDGVSQGKIDPNYILIGHSQLRAIDSPGAMLYNTIRKWDHWSKKTSV